MSFKIDGEKYNFYICCVTGDIYIGHRWNNFSSNVSGHVEQISEQLKVMKKGLA